MTALFWSFLFDTVVRSLPMFFALGIPLLLVAIALAALADTKVPHGS